MSSRRCAGAVRCRPGGLGFRARGKRPGVLFVPPEVDALPFLEPGVYRIEVSAPGFQTVKRESITVSVGQKLNLAVQLPVGQATTEITVTGQQETIETPPKPSKLVQARTVLVEWSSLLRYAGIAALFLVVYLTFMRPIKKQLITAFRELPARIGMLKAGNADHAAVLGRDSLLDANALPGEGGSETQRLSGLKKQLSEKVKSEPTSASRLIQGWMHES